MLLSLISSISNFFSELFKPKEAVIETRIEDAEETFNVDESYLKHFESTLVESKAQLFGREEDVELLKRAYDSWEETNNPLLVIGEPGMGVTSLLLSTTELYNQAHVVKDGYVLDTRQQLIDALKPCFGIDGEIGHFDQLVAAMDDEKYVVIFENIERLFLRIVGGFKLLDEFILFVHATKHKVYWVLTVNQYSFYYLDKVRDFASNFNSVLYLNPISKEAMRNIFDIRNQGYSVQYLKPNKISQTLRAKLDSSKENSQEALENDFFFNLYNFSEGNISRALLYWRKAIRRTNEKTVYVKVFEPRKMSDLSLSETLILEAIMQHSSLSVNELRKVLRKTSKGGMLAIAKLMEKNALVYKHYKGSAQPEYQINPLYMPAVRQQIKTLLNRKMV